MYTVTWIEAGTLHTVSTPTLMTAWMMRITMPRSRLWYTAKKGKPALVH